MTSDTAPIHRIAQLTRDSMGLADAIGVYAMAEAFDIIMNTNEHVTGLQLREQLRDAVGKKGIQFAQDLLA